MQKKNTNKLSTERKVIKALDTIGTGLKRKGISLGQLMKSGRKIRAELLDEEYGIREID
jgi:hypothetical protein